MKRSQLNPKPIKLTPIEACAFIGKAIYEAISSDEVSLVEKGEIDSTPTMQNALKPKKQKTVTEIMHDQLGPGLDPDIFLDVIKDDSKNDEDSNRAK